MPPSVKKTSKTASRAETSELDKGTSAVLYCAGYSSDTDGSCSCPGTGKGKDPLASAVACRTGEESDRSQKRPSRLWPGSGARATDRRRADTGGSQCPPQPSTLGRWNQPTKWVSVFSDQVKENPNSCCSSLVAFGLLPDKKTNPRDNTSQVEVNCSAMTVMTFSSLMSPQRGVSRHGPRLAQRLSCGDKTCVSNPSQPSLRPCSKVTQQRR